MRSRHDHDADFTAYASVAVLRLRDTAYLMCRDWHLAEDLTQTALTKLYVAWPRVSKADNVDAYARTVLLRSFLDHRRRRSTAEVPRARLPETAGGEERSSLRLTLIDALATLRPLDRAILVLRYWEDYSIEATAAVVGVSTGTVKQRSMRGLSALRAALPEESLESLHGAT